MFHNANKEYTSIATSNEEDKHEERKTSIAHVPFSLLE